MDHIILIFIFVLLLLVWRFTSVATDTTTTTDSVEHLVRTDSTYSNCRVGCIIACSNSQTGELSDACYKQCVHQCWNY